MREDGYEGSLLAVGRNADNAVFEKDLCSSNDEGHLLISEVGHEVRDALKFMVLGFHLKQEG